MRRKNTDHARSSRVDPAMGRNPLIRPADRIQSKVKSVVVTLMILMLPLAVWCGMSTMSSQQDRVVEQQGSRHAVTAVTTADADAQSPLVQSDFTSQSSTPVDSTWTYRGVEHHEQVAIATGSPAGTTVPIWVDNDGVRSTQPLSHADAVAAGIFTGAGSLFAVGLILIGLYSAVRFRLDAKRDADWNVAIKHFMDSNSLS